MIVSVILQNESIDPPELTGVLCASSGYILFVDMNTFLGEWEYKNLDNVECCVSVRMLELKNVSKSAESSSLLTPIFSPFHLEVTRAVTVPIPSRMRNDQKTVGFETDDQRLIGLISAAAAFYPDLFFMFALKHLCLLLRGGRFEACSPISLSPCLTASPINPPLMHSECLSDWLCCALGIELVRLPMGSIICCLINIYVCFISTTGTFSFDSEIMCTE